ncbi:MAG: glucose-6-phosphate isomerase [Rhodobacteraceae bacterium]|nr:glucose-6-phosphate isomerase [Paracoccaceae bacterium]
MYKVMTAAVLAGAMSIAGCTMTDQERLIAGGIVGAGAGLLTASAFGANSNWTVVSVLAGAAVGTLVARNAQTGECAYYAGTDAQGRDRYEVRPCPR